MSKWLVGSSKKRRLTGFNKILPSITLLLSPPDKIEIFLSAESPENIICAQVLLTIVSVIC